MKKLFFFLFCLFAGKHSLMAQESPSRQKVAIFAPLYLDSAFNDTAGYRYAKNVFPKFINPGLEFYEGAQLALDSLNKEQVPLDVFVYDTRSATESLEDQLNKPEMDSVGLIIAHCSNAEIKPLADAGLHRNIPVINVNMPNDGGVTGNPYYVILNPTLRTQCEGIYRHIQKYYALDPIVVFSKKGELEDRIKFYFDDIAKNTVSVPLVMKWVELTDSFSLNQLRSRLDTSVQTLCISGSLDESFGKRLVQQLAALNRQNYQVTIMGMPTWDDISFSRPEYKGIEIVYSSPFYNSKTDRISAAVTGYFNRIMFARPSDMVFRGYEVTWKYSKLLVEYGSDLGSNLSNKKYPVFTEFDIQPVLGKQSMTLDYFENKKLYFLKWMDGVIKAVF